jgi:mycoredoxin
VRGHRVEGPEAAADEEQVVVVYGTDWCPDSRRARRWLVEAEVPHRYVDLDHDSAARARVRTLPRGGRQVPTVVLPDGAVLVVPSAEDLGAALGTRPVT